jgi:hypothetical protein
MRTPFRFQSRSLLAGGLAILALLVFTPLLQAFPPAPPHTIYGVVRDQIGNPLSDGAEVIMEVSPTVRYRTTVVARTDSGLNYKIEVPMDAGMTADLYSPTALLPAAPFRLRIKIGQTTFVPMEMTGDLSKLGRPGGSTRIDLTLGVDADGNGLPDAWEKAVAAFLGRAWQAGQIRPEDLYPGTGMTYRDVYLAGTYAVSPTDGFALNIIHSPGQPPKLAFTAVKGRRYTVQLSEHLNHGWTTVPFRLLPLAVNSAALNAYSATETKRVEIEAPGPNIPVRFYRLIVE